MPDTNPTPSLPSLDDMLHSLLLIEEGEHEFSGKEEDVQELRQLFWPFINLSEPACYRQPKREDQPYVLEMARGDV